MTLWFQCLARTDSAPATLGFPGKEQLAPGMLQICSSAMVSCAQLPWSRRIRVGEECVSSSPPRGAKLGGYKSNTCNPKAMVTIFKWLLSCYPSPPLSFLLHPNRITDKRVKSSLGPPAQREGSCNVVSRPSEDIYKFPQSLRVYL